jgi:hypothetical protein
MTEVCDTTTAPFSRPVARATAHGSETACHVSVLLFCGAILAGAAVLTPGEEGLSLFGYRWPFYCWLHETLGIKCAFCGMSRSFCALAHGDLSAGWRFHRLGPAVFALFCLQLPYRLYALAIRPRRLKARLSRLHGALLALVGVAVLANWTLYLGGLLL